MRRALDRLTWVVMIGAIAILFRLSSPPDVESLLGVPACTGKPHAGPCRLCSHRGKVGLPPVIDADNVRFIQLDARTAGRAGF